ncbi:MAG: DUF962 domain-containing protein [Acidobacteriota bacterium]
MTDSRMPPLEQYAASHQHPINRLCHAIGIPLIALSITLAAIASFVAPALIVWCLGGFVAGWGLQIVGHLVEGKPPEFLQDWRFLLVGIRWWWMELLNWIGCRPKTSR